MSNVLCSAGHDASLQYACPRCRGKLDLSVQNGRCSVCGLQPRKFGDIFSFMEQLEGDDWQKLFEAQATGPEGNTSSAVCYRFSVQHGYMIDGFRQACGPMPAEARILDAGCGNGIFWKEIFGTTNVIGVDYSLSMCKLARARGMVTHQADALALPFAERQFDLIYAAEVLQCVFDLPALLSELARVCRPGGRIAVSTANSTSALRQGMRAATAMLWWRPTKGPINLLRTAEDVVSAAKGLPLTLESVWWTHFPFGYVYRTGTVQYGLQSLASNLIVRFLRTDI